MAGLRSCCFAPLVALAAGLASSSCDHATAPAEATQVIAVGSAVDGSLDAGGRAARYSITVAAGSRYLVYVAVLSGAVEVSVEDQAGTIVTGPVRVVSNGQPLAQSPVLQFSPGLGGAWSLKVDGSPAGSAAAFRLLVIVVSDAPEHLPAAIAPGDSVAGESIDLPGDVDEFTFRASAGQVFNAFLQGGSESPGTVFRLDAIDADGIVLATVTSSGTDAELLGQLTPRFTMRSAGTHRLRVSGTAPGGEAAGAYRLFLSLVDRRPESHAASLAFGDSVLVEAIDVPGDMDEYRVLVPDTSGANLAVAVATAPPGGNWLQAQLIDSATGKVVAEADAHDAGGRAQSGRLHLAPGRYVVRVLGAAWDSVPHERGDYQLWLYGFKFGPEKVADTLVLGDTVRAEAIDVPGDVDVYRFPAAQGQHVNVTFQGLGAPADAALEACVSVSGGPPGCIALLGTPVSSPSVATQTMRLDLPAAPWYTVTVSGGGSPVPSAGEVGPYRLSVVPADVGPENVSPAVTLGDSITTESLDAPGDWDQFLLSAQPGREVLVLFGSQMACCVYPYVTVTDPGSGVSLASAVGQGFRLTQAARVPASGQLAIAVYQPPPTESRVCLDATCGGIYGLTGPYVLQALAFDRLPETASAAYTLGDTVVTERLDRPGDVDEFTLTATPGRMLVPYFRLLAASQPADRLIGMQVVDTAGGVVVGLGSYLSDVTADFVPLQAFMVPASGKVLLRFCGTGPQGDDVATAPYAFYVAPAP
jgi:hypothetical protein